MTEAGALQLARFFCHNHFAFSPYTSAQILKVAPWASFVRPMDYWHSNGYEVVADASYINVPLPHNAQNALTTDPSGDVITYINYPFYDVKDTNCHLRLKKIQIQCDILPALAAKLGLDICYKPLKRMLLQSYLCDNIIVLPSTCNDIEPLLLKHIAEYLLDATSTQKVTAIQAEHFLTCSMLCEIFNAHVPVYSAPDISAFADDELYCCIYHASRIVWFLLENLGVDIDVFMNKELNYCVTKKDKPISTNASKFKWRKRK